jgi:hypothetical protein
VLHDEVRAVSEMKKILANGNVSGTLGGDSLRLISYLPIASCPGG